jgi:drug/metabolite transporter (DMT)-like permease
MASRVGWSLGRQAWRRLPHPLRWLGVAIVGGALIVAGAIMLVTPGPGIAMIVLGLVVLATEFAWAERTLHKVRNGSGRAYRATRDRLRKR